MKEKFNFWGIWVTPWTKEYRLLLPLYIFVLICVILGLVYITTETMSSHIIWLFLVPVVFYGVNLVVGILVDRLRKKLPPDGLLQTDCIIVNNVLQTPGIAHLENEHIILQPLLGRQLSIPFGDTRKFRVRRWYNGQGYWGQTIFFEISDSKRWRLGFGVADAKLWQNTLDSCIKGFATE